MLSLVLLAASLSCPVLSTASVSGVFGEVQLNVTTAEKGARLTCVFMRTDYRLSVDVSELAAPAKFSSFAASNCRGGEALAVKAIGNEAVACRVGTVVDKVVGRVRNQVFVLSLNTTDKTADAKSIRTKIIGLAEQVAGNLF